MPKYKNFLGLGIAGNFAMHLDQAGEAEDFKDIITADEAAPKGMFPFYLPCSEHDAKSILSTYPLDAKSIKLPVKNVNVQAEPEVGLICRFIYDEAKNISKIIPTHFGAYNDCSIRVKGASKISDKKNWGPSSKGISETLFPIDKFDNGGVMDNFSIASFLRRDDKVHPYGEDVELNGYSYFYDKLLDWIILQLNTQKNFGPLESINQYIKLCNYPDEVIISIGATRYTNYGENTFLKLGDEIIIVVYDHNKYTKDEIISLVSTNSLANDDKAISALIQKVY